MKVWEYGLWVGILLSVVLVLWQHYGMNNHVVISPQTAPEVFVFGDSADGGNSTGTVQHTDSSWLIHYNIGNQIRFPYVTFSIVTDHFCEGRGLDLSSVDSILV